MAQSWSLAASHEGSQAPSEADPESGPTQNRRRQRLEMAIAVVLLVCVGVRRELAAALSVGDCVALASVPVTWTAVRNARRFSLLLTMSILAAGTTYIMSLLAESSFVVEAWARRVTTLSLLAVPCAVAVFVWGARRLGARRAALAVGVGMFLDSLPLFQTSPNPWKFGVGAAVSIIVLSLVANRRRLVQIVALLGLSGVFLVSDSRSTLAFLAIILGTVVWQALASWARWHVPTPRRLAVSQIIVLAVVGAVAMAGVVVASQSGTLGEDAQNRTIAQSSSSAGLLLSARPELGASWALFRNRPWGYGAGVKPRFEDLWVAKQGMAALGYNPENGYVENFMFGGRIELHSGLMDMWAAASIPGGLLLLLIAGMTLAAMMRDLGRLKATPWLFFAALTVVQNVFVGPWTVLPAYLPIVLGAAVLQPALRDAAQLVTDGDLGDEAIPKTGNDVAPSGPSSDVAPTQAPGPHVGTEPEPNP
ncbi:Tat pathway signal sequence domain protein [Actinomyces sp. oral taxon 170 str. F0386]|nr:Tat pathway signal sequence domain protein [Actinomyces sp. oral taxon 170 str. F0386]